MTTNLITKTIHQKETFATISHKDVEYILADYIAKQCSPKISIGADGISYTVTFEDATEGSPGYKVGIKAKVQIIQNFEPLPVAEK